MSNKLYIDHISIYKIVTVIAVVFISFSALAINLQEKKGPLLPSIAKEAAVAGALATWLIKGPAIAIKSVLGDIGPLTAMEKFLITTQGIARHDVMAYLTAPPMAFFLPYAMLRDYNTDKFFDTSLNEAEREDLLTAWYSKERISPSKIRRILNAQVDALPAIRGRSGSIKKVGDMHEVDKKPFFEQFPHFFNAYKNDVTVRKMLYVPFEEKNFGAFSWIHPFMRHRVNTILQLIPHVSEEQFNVLIDELRNKKNKNNENDIEAAIRLLKEKYFTLQKQRGNNKEEVKIEYNFQKIKKEQQNKKPSSRENQISVAKLAAITTGAATLALLIKQYFQRKNKKKQDKKVIWKKKHFKENDN